MENWVFCLTGPLVRGGGGGVCLWVGFGRTLGGQWLIKTCSAGIDICAALFAHGCLRSTARWSKCPCQTMGKAGFIENRAGSHDGVQKQQAGCDGSSHPLCILLHFNSSQLSLAWFCNCRDPLLGETSKLLCSSWPKLGRGQGTGDSYRCHCGQLCRHSTPSALSLLSKII